MTPATPARMTHDYVRHGTTSLFAALDIASGSMIAQHYCRHRHQEFLRFLKVIDAAVPQHLELHLVLDNYATHKTESVKKWLLRHPRFHLHFTPTSASWLNLVERWFAELTSRKLRRSAHRGVVDSNATSAAGSTSGTRTPSRSSGRRPPTTSPKPSPHTAHELTTQDTRALAASRPSREADVTGTQIEFPVLAGAHRENASSAAIPASSGPANRWYAKVPMPVSRRIRCIVHRATSAQPSGVEAMAIW